MKSLMAEGKQIVLKYNLAVSSAEAISFSVSHDSAWKWGEDDGDAQQLIKLLADLRRDVCSQGLSKAMTEPLPTLRKGLNDDGEFIGYLHKIKELEKRITVLTGKTVKVKKLHEVKHDEDAD